MNETALHCDKTFFHQTNEQKFIIMEQMFEKSAQGVWKVPDKRKRTKGSWSVRSEASTRKMA